MDDFPGLMADFGFRQQGKAAPMAPSKSASIGSRSANPLSFEDIFNSSTTTKSSSASSMPVYDKPVYDDDIFEGVPGIRSTSSSNKVEYEDVFASNLSKGGGHVEGSGGFDDLLGGLGSLSSRVESKMSKDFGGFDELLPGFGGSSPPNRREPSESSQQKSSESSEATPNDPFAAFEMASAPTYSSSGMASDPLENHNSSLNSDPFENIGKPTNFKNTNADTSPASSGMFDDINAFDGFSSKSVPSYTSDQTSRKEKSPPNFGTNGASEKSSADSFDNMPKKRSSVRSFDSVNSIQSPKSEDSPYERNARLDQFQSPISYGNSETTDDIWLTVSEIPLFTQPTSALPPSRPPPSLVNKSSNIGRVCVGRKKNESYSYIQDSVRKHGASSPIDDLEDFAMGRSQSNENADVLSEDSFKTNSAAEASAAAMKEAMDRAEAKFKHAKEVRERERDARYSKGGEDGTPVSNRNDNEEGEKQDQLEREKLQRELEERRRVEKERQLEKERNRQAVERATREARHRAAAEAMAKQERAAVDKANAEARLRAERAAVQRAANEARERAAAEARERAAAEAKERAAAEARERAAAAESREKAAREKAASEARDRERAAVNRAAAEARARAGRAAVDRAHAEARERAAAEARDKAAASSVNREKQSKTENDLESFFGMGSRANSTPKQRATASDTFSETQTQGAGSADISRRASSTTSSTIRKASSTANIVDDLTSIFGGASSSGDFQEVDGETEERRRARLERHQRTTERAAKALAEKNERDMQAQREQAERNRLSETLDIEIKRWAAGKEGNLRALLSTLQYVLWPECGWQPVSLTDLITGAHVKKVYRKATLCIHPDKVQQKGATLQQKYIAEKVFDLLKEAWNKFNSEELF